MFVGDMLAKEVVYQRFQPWEPPGSKCCYSKTAFLVSKRMNAICILASPVFRYDLPRRDGY